MPVLELKTKEDKTLYEIYRRLFAAATPSGDFDKLVANAKIDEHGRKHIPFMDYEITSNDMDNIIMTVLKENKIKKGDWGKFKTTVYLGCSPKTKIGTKKN